MKRSTDSAVKPDAPDLIALVRAARRQYRPGTGTVYDRLLRQAGSHLMWLGDELRSTCGVDTVSADEVEPDFTLLNAATASAWRCVVLRSGHDDVLRLGAEDPWDEALLHKASLFVGQPLVPAAVTFADLCRWLGRDGGLPVVVASPGDGASSVSTGPRRPDEVRALHADAMALRFADDVINAALGSGTSDIHFECDRTGVTARHRRDGVLSPYARLEGAHEARELMARLRGLAQIEATDPLEPLEGRWSHRQAPNARPVELRLSIMPSASGEDAVLRFADRPRLRAGRMLSLDQLSIDTGDMLRIRRLLRQPGGLLLVSGPARSGKTTTACAMLAELDAGHEKILSIEDPIEYELPGVRQLAVDERRGLDFASGLALLLSHDPDRILVGELCDAATAQRSLHASLAGCGVLATLQARDVVDTLGCLRQFGLDMVAAMSALNGVVVQRLLRAPCGECRATRDTSAAEREWLASLGQCDVLRVPQAMGCGVCHHSGYRGRLLLTEVHLIDDAWRDVVARGCVPSFIRRHACTQGVSPLAEQAARRVRAGDLTIEETRRVLCGP